MNSNIYYYIDDYDGDNDDDDKERAINCMRVDYSIYLKTKSNTFSVRKVNLWDTMSVKLRLK